MHICFFTLIFFVVNECYDNESNDSNQYNYDYKIQYNNDNNKNNNNNNNDFNNDNNNDNNQTIMIIIKITKEIIMITTVKSEI